MEAPVVLSSQAFPKQVSPLSARLFSAADQSTVIFCLTLCYLRFCDAVSPPQCDPQVPHHLGLTMTNLLCPPIIFHPTVLVKLHYVIMKKHSRRTPVSDKLIFDAWIPPFTISAIQSIRNHHCASIISPE